MKRLVFIIMAAVLAFNFAMAQDQSAVSITKRINKSGNITVKHPDALESRVAPDARAKAHAVTQAVPDTLVVSQSTQKVSGYRVQVFSDNNHNTAKGEAKAKESAIAERFPEYATYVTYTSPYWRLRVGDFRSREDAEMVANDIKRAFPAYAREIRVVKDRVNVSSF